MSGSITVAGSQACEYNDCLFANLLRKLFSMGSKAKPESNYLLTNTVAAIQTQVQALQLHASSGITYEYLAAMEASLPEVAFRYVVITRQEQPVVLCYFQLFTVTSANFRGDGNEGLKQRVINFFLDLNMVRVLISGNALRTENCCYCYNDKVLSRDEAIELLAATAEKIACDEKALAVVLKDIRPTPSAATTLTKNGFSAPWKDQGMVLDLRTNWISLDDYINDLSRKYRARVTKILSAGSELVEKQLELADLEQYREDTFSLFQDVLDQQPFLLTSPAPDHLVQLKKCHGADFEVCGLFLDGKMVAFYSGFVHEHTYEVYHVGLNYQLNNKYQLYFNLLYGSLGRAIALKKSRLNLGRTSFDAKASMGAHAEDYIYFFKSPKVPQRIVKRFADYFSSFEDGKWRLRNPLRQEPVMA